MSETNGPPYNDPREAAIAIEIIARNVNAIVEDFVPGDKNNLGQQILNTWLITDKRIKSVALLANRHRYFRENKISPSYAKTIIANTAEELHTQKLMQEGMSPDEARVRAKEFRKERTSLVHERWAERAGSAHFSEKGKLQEAAWPQDKTESLMQRVVDPNYRWQSGRYQGTPNWGEIVKDLEITTKQAKDHYDYIKKGIETKTIGSDVIEYAEKIGIYNPKERTDWSTLLPRAIELLKTDRARFVWQEGGNKNKPNWYEIMRQLESEGKLPFSIDWDDPKQVRKYARELSNAYKRRMN